MKKKISTAPFHGTKEQEEKLLEVIERHKNDSGRGGNAALMQVMQEAQEIYGYLPLEVQAMIARGLGISVEEVYGVSTFYSQFALAPKGRNRVSVCLGTACYVKGSKAILDRIETNLGIGPDECTEDGRFSLEACRCVGACGLAPVMIINDKVYGRVQLADVDGILAEYK